MPRHETMASVPLRSARRAQFLLQLWHFDHRTSLPGSPLRAQPTPRFSQACVKPAGMIESLEKLEACLGKTPAAMALKVLDHLDDGALRWLRASPLVFVSTARAAGVSVTIAGGERGFARAVSPQLLRLPRAAIDDADALEEGRGVGMLFLVPGLGETLRVNGRVTSHTADAVELAIQEVYVHCAKALIRSEFWTAAPRSEETEPACFVTETRFIAFATADAEGNADLSPKGDAAGTMLKVCGDGLAYGERPGNLRKDSLKNLLVQPRAAVLALIPGSNLVGLAHGEGKILEDLATREQFTISGKTPKLVMQLRAAELFVHESPALARCALWPLRAEAHGLDPAAILTTHIKQNKTAGLGVGIVRKLMSKELMRLGLDLDYKNKLY
jgi:predicted pyridoxine 5'-phosphate oxidase superfamily flavin-nucleotide-binding protein